MTSRVWALVRPIAGLAVLGALAWRLGAETFLDGLGHVEPMAVLVAVAVTAVTTACCARRWSLLAAHLGVPVSLGEAFRACYRAQFLNAVLPGGVVGDVHRGVQHGRGSNSLGRGLGSVASERMIGQAVQIAMALAAWGALAGIPLWALAVPATCLVLAVGRWWREVVALSVVAALGHLLVFVVAARIAGVTAPLSELVPIGLVVLVAAAIPFNIAGWGPREGAAAWVFASVGLGGATGLEVSVVYGVLAFISTLPGALALGTPSTHAHEPERGDAWPVRTPS